MLLKCHTGLCPYEMMAARGAGWHGPVEGLKEDPQGWPEGLPQSSGLVFAGLQGSEVREQLLGVQIWGTLGVCFRFCGLRAALSSQGWGWFPRRSPLRCTHLLLKVLQCQE